MRFRLLSLTVSLVLSFAVTTAVAWPSKFNNDVERRQDRNSTFLKDYPGQGKLPSLDVLIKLNQTEGTFLNTDNIQGDILIGMKKPKELFFFFYINDPKKFKAVLAQQIYPYITTTSQLICSSCTPTKALLNVAFTQPGLVRLNVLDNLNDPAYSLGQAADAYQLGDPGTKNWIPAFTGNRTHGVFLIASDDWAPINSLLSQILAWLGTSIVETYRLQGSHRPAPYEGKEHFGFQDGISQPAVAGFSTFQYPGQSLIFPGTLLLLEPGDLTSRPAWSKDGSFLAFRQLQQFVPEFDKYLLDNPIPIPGWTVQQGADLLGARMIGRWKSGTPLDLAPLVDNPSIGPDPNQNNDFDFDHPPPFNLATDQTYCPWSAHIRKTRPRADEGNLNLINQIMRSGIPYGNETTAGEYKANTTKLDRGLAFVSYQSDLSQGFRFQQIRWANDPNFVPGKSDPTPGYDPIIGQNGVPGTTFASGLDVTDPTRDLKLAEFVRSRGGGYFFSPSLSAILNPICV